MFKIIKMKNNIIAFAAILFLSFGVHAQIDRSKQPEAGPAPKLMLKSLKALL